MFRSIAIRGYMLLHGVAWRAMRLNPFVARTMNGRPIAHGFISEEHLANPALDDRLVEELREAGIDVRDYRIDLEGYREYLRRAEYPRSYHGGAAVKGAPTALRNFTEKTLEHYVSAELLGFAPDDVFIDVAARSSPFHRIVRDLWGVRRVYRQDLEFEAGVHGETIGGSAGRLPLPDDSVSKVTLHCSLEHFEGDSDIELFREMSRVLRPGGRMCVLPFYIAREYTIHTDPIFDLLFGRGLRFDPEARVRYCSWNNRHGRHYDVERVKRRILSSLGRLRMTVFRVENFREVDPHGYLRFAAVFEKGS